MDRDDDNGVVPAELVFDEDDPNGALPRVKTRSPTKGRSPKAQPQSTKSEAKMAQVIDLQRRAFGRHTRLRQMAGIAYITDPDDPTVEKLGKDPRFTNVSPKTLAQWCAKDHWADQRAKFLEGWKAKTLQRLETPLAQGLRAELETLQVISERAHDWLQHPMVMPTSFEGVAKTIMQINERRERVRDRLASLAGDRDDAKPDESPLSPDEIEAARAAAHAVLEQRRAQLAIPATTASEPDDESVDEPAEADESVG